MSEPLPRSRSPSHGNGNAMNDHSDDGNVCRDFLHGRCARGAGCKFAHPEGRGAPPMSSNNDGGRAVCRDYERGQCSRGPRCKFAHPGEGAASASSDAGGGDDIVFCRDFQTRGCERESCRFVHCLPAEEEDYRRSGRKRPAPYDREFYPPGPTHRGGGEPWPPAPPPVGRRDMGPPPPPAFAGGPPHPPPGGPMPTDYRSLVEENTFLRQQVDDLRRQCIALRSTNDVLLESNARFRNG